MSRDGIARYFEADVCCYHCGRVAGLLRRACDKPGAPMAFVDQTHGVQLGVKRLTNFRCAHCRGSVYAGPFELRQEYVPLDWPAERPRRGRPRKLPAARAARAKAS